jgi:hypothetical protein
MSEALRTTSLSDKRIYDKSSPKMTPVNIQQGHLWKDFANGLTEPTNSICGLALNGIQYILLGINAWVQPILWSVVSHSRPTRHARHWHCPSQLDESTWSLPIQPQFISMVF